ncbi:ATP-binding protein [Mucilaginibacter sp.]|uniref:AlbA family DNA-binding domain-containing protein n=1 Tax=Mucilaginibacter sp. TaxID=1882438 RepID=UPI00284883D4|nr:ATP-binding protein [Mucilaginibacter sp.]MDR3695675.1 ATP-binding protein [Mucilaginibacter sp.]
MTYNQEYLISIIQDRIEESINLEFKGAGALERQDNKVKEISKDISAFANSAGGIIIYGLKEDNINKHLASSIEPIERKLISKEWLEQIIQSNIQPRIEDIQIYPIEIDGDVEKVVYLINVGKSSTAHQANDHKYYRRYNFISVPMNDYEVRDVFNRPKHPKLLIEFEIWYNEFNGTREYRLLTFAKNAGVVLCNYINCYIMFQTKRLKSEHIPSSTQMSEFFGDNTVRDIVDVKMTMPGQPPIYKYGPSRFDPLLPRLRTKLDTKEIILNHYYRDENSQIEWTVYGDNAEPTSGIIGFRDIPTIWK